MKKHIPNFITTLNLICGCAGIGLAIKEEFALASYSIGIAAFFDILDGLLARMLHVKSEMGKELDSLADLISFGMLPGIILYFLLNRNLSSEEGFIAYLPFIAFLIPVFSALRLAKFNTDDRQSDCFIGVPTPAIALFVASIPLILINPIAEMPILATIFSNPIVLILLILALSYLLVSPFRLFSFKFKKFSWKEHKIIILFIITAIILLVLFRYFAVPVVFFLYIVFSFIHNSTQISKQNIVDNGEMKV